MIQWKEEAVITANIETVWSLFSDKNIKKIMPKVEEHILIEKCETEAGAKHRQTYREGKRLETYIVETLIYQDKEAQKKKQIRFVLGKAFEVTLSFTLIKIDESQTRLIYEGENRGVNFVGRAMLKLAGKKSNHDVVMEFLDRVQVEAMK
ncbi:SRPBCC family protein [Robertmurraya korlensis]|uniref:SRPBCC family protein n=1 Tax=Robertmurraya korlensis TaxID=519977 RepID=UPI00203E261F|nr:SRPBCC family protein [Robertmurraya korlensis]